MRNSQGGISARRVGGAGRPRRAALSLLVALLVPLASGCIRHVRTPLAQDLRPPAAARVQFAAWNDLEIPGPAPTVKRLGDRSSRHRRFALSMPSVTDNNQARSQVTATYFATTSSTPRPLVVVLPIWGSSQYPPRKIVRWLTSDRRAHPANVLMIHGDERLIDWPAAETIESEADLEAVVDRWIDSLAGSVVDIRRLIRWSHTRPEVARNRVGIVGFSIGALVGGVVAGTDPHVSGGVFVAGGANLHEILASCRGNTKRFRESVETRLGWSKEQLEAWLEPRLRPLNPTVYADEIDPRGVLIIDAGRDNCIPKSARDDLWNAMGRPERLSIGHGHKISFLSMTFLGFHFTSHEIVDFLDRTLLSPLPRREDDRPIRDLPVRSVRATPDRN